MTYLLLTTLIIPSVLIVIAGIIYWMLKPSDKINKDKRHLLLVIISLLLLSVNALNYYTYNNMVVDLENENKDLIDDKENLQETNGELKSTKIGLTEQIEDLNSQIVDHDNTVTDLNDVIERLDNENKEMNSKNNILIDRIKSLEANNTQVNVVDNKSANDDIQDTKDKIDIDNDGECNIKGSVNGIYHPPSSTYYSRTQNVVEWFCTTEEAVKAGYRAPYK